MCVCDNPMWMHRAWPMKWKMFLLVPFLHKARLTRLSVSEVQKFTIGNKSIQLCNVYLPFLTGIIFELKQFSADLTTIFSTQTKQHFDLIKTHTNTHVSCSTFNSISNNILFQKQSSILSIRKPVLPLLDMFDYDDK